MSTITQTQIEKLRALSTSQKYGSLIEDAIKTWESGIGFKFGSFGIFASEINNKYKLYSDSDSDNCCCLVGAALIGKNIGYNSSNNHYLESISEAISRIYGIKDAVFIYKGFDCKNNTVFEDYKHNESFMIGYRIRQILLDGNSE